LIFSGSVLLTCVKDCKMMKKDEELKIVVLFCVWVTRCDSQCTVY